MSNPSKSRVTVVLGDPRLPYDYNESGAFERHDHRAVERLKSALGELDGYEFTLLDDHAGLYEQLTRVRAGLVLNLCNSGYGNRVSRQLHVPALLEALEMPYIGAGPECMALCHDKEATLGMAAARGVPVPRQTFGRVGGGRALRAPSYPALVKPNFGDGSTGVEGDAIVHDEDELGRRLKRLGEQFDRPAVLIQEYLPGAEYSVGVIGNPDTGLRCLPPLQVDFSGLDPDLPPILTYASKVQPQSRQWKQVRLRPAELSDEGRELHGYCRTVFERLGCRDYARFDFRCGLDGTPRLIDVNCHPMWGEGGMMATMAGFAGLGYAQMLERIIRAGAQRLRGRGAPGEAFAHAVPA